QLPAYILGKLQRPKPNFLSQPVVKNIFMYRNGDPYYDARRIVINQKRVSNFETLLREVTGGIQAPFGAVRNIYTPRGGHKVDCLESLQSGEQYVAAGRERFKRMDYLQIAIVCLTYFTLCIPLFQARPLPPNRFIVSARFLKPIKEPCTIFVVANGDVLDPAMRLLVHQRMLGQFDRILEMITEKMGLKVLGGVRSLYTYEGQQVTDGNQLEGGQLYVAVGRERFKKLHICKYLTHFHSLSCAAGMKYCDRYTGVLAAAFTTQQQGLVGLDVPRQLLQNPKSGPMWYETVIHYLEDNKLGEGTNKLTPNTPETRNGGRLGLGFNNPNSYKKK
uniref:Doublecortin domain-containing protein 2 n=1 Tax=Sander lucioperca TaxID=283035 RepID=A0A8C9XK34_SANLU